MGKYKIAIVNSSSFGKIFHEQLERLEKIGEVQSFTVDGEIGGRELAELLKGYNIIIASVTPFFTQEFFDHKDELILITRHGIGYNNIDIEAGTSVPTVQEAEIKAQMTQVSTEVLGMITNDKFGTISNAIVGPVDDLSFLISEDIPDKVRKEYSKKKLLLID